MNAKIKLIEIVPNNQILWNQWSSSYKTISLKDEDAIWESIGIELGITGT